MDILDVFVLAGRGSARASEDRGAWLKAGAARVRAHPTIVYFSIFWDAVVVGVTHDPPHEVGGAQRRSRRLFLTVLYFVFVFSLGGPTPSEAAGGRPLTQRSKTLGPGIDPLHGNLREGVEDVECRAL